MNLRQTIQEVSDKSDQWVRRSGPCGWRPPILLRRCSTIWAAFIWHATMAFILLFVGDSVFRTLKGKPFGIIDGRIGAGIVLFLACGMTVYAVWLYDHTKHRRLQLVALSLLFPQQMLLVISSMSVITALFSSTYGPVIDRSWDYILSNHMPVILLTFAHFWDWWCYSWLCLGPVRRKEE